MELHQMSVHALTEKLEKAERELAVAVIENADLRERLSSLESLYRARDKDCAAKDAELERVHGILKAAQSRSDWGCSACEMYQGVADALASPAAEPSTDTDVGTKTQQPDMESLTVAEPERKGDRLFCDLKTDEEKAAFFLSGRGYETGVIAPSIQNDVAMAYHRCSEYRKETEALQAENERLRKDAETDQHPCCWAPSKALKELERGMNNSPCILTDSPTELNDTPLYAHPQPSPDVDALVEALSIARDYVFSSLEEKKLALAGYPQMWRCEQDDLAMIDATLSAYRKETSHDK